MSNSLEQGQELTVGQHLDSPDGRATLLLQSDGNLVLYRTVDHQPVWASNTVGSGSVRAVMQTDGNFVLYTAQGRPRWATATNGASGLRLELQNDGNLVIYLGSSARWASGTAGSLRDRGPDRLIPPQEIDLHGSITSLNGGATLRLEPGWLTLYRTLDGKRLWSAAGGNYAKMQSDGNFVSYATGHHPVFATGTNGKQGAYLVLQDDGNLVVYLDDKALWATGTNGQIDRWEPPVIPAPVLSSVTDQSLTATVTLDRQHDGHGHPWQCAFTYTKGTDSTQWGVPGVHTLFDGVYSLPVTGLPADTDITVFLMFFNDLGQRYVGLGTQARTQPHPPPPPPPPDPTSGTVTVSLVQDGPDAWSYSAEPLDPNGYHPPHPALVQTITSLGFACSLSVAGSGRVALIRGVATDALRGAPVESVWSAIIGGRAEDRPGAFPLVVTWKQ